MYNPTLNYPEVTNEDSSTLLVVTNTELGLIQFRTDAIVHFFQHVEDYSEMKLILKELATVILN